MPVSDQIEEVFWYDLVMEWEIPKNRRDRDRFARRHYRIANLEKELGIVENRTVTSYRFPTWLKRWYDKAYGW